MALKSRDLCTPDSQRSSSILTTNDHYFSCTDHVSTATLIVHQPLQSPAPSVSLSLIFNKCRRGDSAPWYIDHLCIPRDFHRKSYNNFYSFYFYTIDLTLSKIRVIWNLLFRSKKEFFL